jgi:hypothetical protein
MKSKVKIISVIYISQIDNLMNMSTVKLSFFQYNLESKLCNQDFQ